MNLDVKPRNALAFHAHHRTGAGPMKDRRNPRVAVLRHVAQVVVALTNGQSEDARTELDKALQAAARAEALEG